MMSLKYSNRPRSTTFPLYMGFADFEKAFDSIQYRAVFEALRARGMQEKYSDIIEETCAEGTAQVRTEKLGRKIDIMKGERQGATLSPVVLTAAVEIFKMINIEAAITSIEYD